jgi:flagellar biosynthesis GTPase FlhF
MKTFHADTMPEAIEMVRVTLGDAAIIIGSQRGDGGRGVRVTAAIDESEEDHAPPPPVDQPLDALEAIADALDRHGVPAALMERLLVAATPLAERLVRAATAMAVDAPDAAASIKEFQLAPTRANLGPNPWGQVDFTAYTLEFGEVKLGFSNVMVGVAPHVQLGTSPLLDLARVPNVNVKAHLFQESAALRVIQKRNDAARKAAEAEGRPFTEAEAYRPRSFDLAVRGNYTYLPRGAVTGSYMSAGTTASWAVNRYWGLHAGADYALLDSSGGLDFSTIGELALGRDVPPGTHAADVRLKGGTVDCH